MSTKTNDLHIRSIHPLISPSVLLEELPLPNESALSILRGRNEIKNILAGLDGRLLVIVGPCSIHDTKAGMDYAGRLHRIADKYRGALCIVLRVYFEKPRTRLGWKGLINDPDMDGSYQINKGLRLARRFLLEITELGLPAATEFLDTTFGQYYADLISLGAIGARTTESQVHRELASGLSMPVGFKNRTDGDVKVAVDAIVAAAESHSFPSLTRDGAPAIMETSGNKHCCLILRGGNNGPNYREQDIRAASKLMIDAGIKDSIIVDCSHGNSRKDFRNQVLVLEDIRRQMSNSDHSIRGVMIESHINEGKQKLTSPEMLEYGKSITDACIGWEETEQAVEQLSEASIAGMSKAKA